MKSVYQHRPAVILLLLLVAGLLTACNTAEPPMPAAVERWRASGTLVEAAGRTIFAVQRGDGPETLAILHGYPTSSHDFERVLPQLSKRYRVIVHDHPGFGLSEKPENYSYSLVEQADAALLLWQKLGVRRVHLLAHDYGTSVATEILARRERFGLPVTIDSVTLGNGSVHIELADLKTIQRVMANPTLGPLVAPLSSRWFFGNQMRDLWAKPALLTDIDIDAMWALIGHDHGRQRLPVISRYIHERRKFWHRWIGALTRLDVPAHILWAKADPVAVAAIAEHLAQEIPGAELTWLEGIGHYPMIEAPDIWATAVLEFLGKHPAPGNP